ncbi:MAG: hypothetical protein HYZ30_01815 [Candidatus Azosocius agrarius]|nr:MAG: hypothetical protein HYZ30_01815 [Gammaproteobacteria bacterium]
MIIYLVGGYIRDKILGIKATDKDWVIINGLKNFLIKYKFLKIGKHFSVFIHPITKEEYSLARFEKKYIYGYNGFYINCNFSITLKEDLYRRDLSINSIAKDVFFNIIDPYDGMNDVKVRVLRHISIFFMEDPVRILRVARFKSKLNNYNFFVSYETLDLMSYVINTCEMKYLSPERIWKEFIKIFDLLQLKCFFSVLYKCNGLNIISPVLDNFFCSVVLKSKYKNLYVKNYIYTYIYISSFIFKNVIYKIVVFFYKIINFLFLSEGLFIYGKYKNIIINFIYNVFKFYKLSNMHIFLISNLFYFNLYIVKFFFFDERIIVNFLEFFDAFRRPNLCKKFLLLMLIKVNILTYNFINIIILYDILSFINKKYFSINFNILLYKKCKYFFYKKKINLLRIYFFLKQ